MNIKEVMERFPEFETSTFDEFWSGTIKGAICVNLGIDGIHYIKPKDVPEILLKVVTENQSF